MFDKHGWVLWLTGLPAAGKSVLARELWRRRIDASDHVVVLDSDEVRRILTPVAAYTPAERDQFYQRLVDLAALLSSYGVNVIIAATGNRRAYREAARAQLAPFAEVWVRCPAAVCRSRDPKRLYAQADAGELAALPGVGISYETPETPELIIETDRSTVAECVDAIIAGIPFLQRWRE
jgi:adenylylsulfate kinase-like enzyme